MTFKLPFTGMPQPGDETFGHRHAGLRSIIAAALYNAEDLDSTDIEVTVIDGAVILEGSVPSLDEMDRAMAIANAVGGVLVLNRLWRCQH